jgi:hypothetical protein
MSTLTAKQRANLRPKDFGLPEKARTAKARKGTGNYPIPDRGHAISAIRRSAREYERGNLTKKEHDRIQRKAERMLKKKTKKSGKKATKRKKKK